MFRVLIAAIVVALTASNAWAQAFIILDERVIIHDLGKTIGAVDDTKVSFTTTFVEMEEATYESLPHFHHLLGPVTIYSDTGGLVDFSVYMEKGSWFAARKPGPSQVYAGIWKSEQELKKTLARYHASNGVVIHQLDGGEVGKGPTFVYSDLETALQVTEELAKIQDWQVAVLEVEDGQTASATYFTTTGAYGIAAWGDRVVYKAWGEKDLFPDTWGWGEDHLTMADKKTTIVLDRIQHVPVEIEDVPASTLNFSVE